MNVVQQLRRRRHHNPRPSIWPGERWDGYEDPPAASPWEAIEEFLDAHQGHGRIFGRGDPVAWARARMIRFPGPDAGVYFLACAGRIKIGVTENMASRFKAYQTMCPHEPMLLAMVRGGHAEESALHQRFDTYWSHGEWFHMAPPLLDFIDDLVERRKASPFRVGRS